MNTFLVSVGLIVLSFVCHVTCTTTYAVAMLGLDLQDGSASSNKFEVVMINDGGNDIHVKIETVDTKETPETKQIVSKDVEKYDILSNNVLNGSEIANKTVIFSSNDSFILQVFSSTDTHTEALFGIPLEALEGPLRIDNVYEYVVTTFCATSGYCQMAVTSSELVDVRIEFPGHVNDVVFCIGMRFFRSWRDSLVRLDKFDAIQIETTKDLTGTHIYSMGIPIVVYVGSRNVTKGTMTKHMLEQLTPSSHWGKQFGVKTLGQNNYGDVIKIAANWPNTMVKIQGFPNFIISNRSHVVSRRLDKDMVTYIEASHPIQVVQITGLAYASTNETGTVAMTTVPAMEHGLNRTVVACGSEVTKGSFTLISAKIDPKPSVDGTETDDSFNIRYWDHTFSTRQPSGPAPTYEVTGVSVFGIVTCDDMSIFPLNTLFKNSITVADEVDVTIENTCIEGETASTQYEYGQLPLPVVRDLHGYDVIKLRVKVCGEALFTLDQRNNSIVVRLTAHKTYFDLCHDDNCEHTELTTSGHTSTLNCERDMSVYWFRQKPVNATSVLFCFGFGDTHDSSDECSASLFKTHFNTDEGKLFENVSMVGLHSDAFFIMDLETNSGCSVHVSDWRCDDRVQNCSTFGKSICTDPAYSDLANEACRKYCGNCTVDNTGKKFLVVSPSFHGNAPTTDCKIYVTHEHVSDSTVVSVATANAAIPAEDYFEDNTYVYGCTVGTGDFVIVRSNTDVSVTVMYWSNEKPSAYNVYPVDAFDREFMTFSYQGSSKTGCKIVSEDTDVNVVPYFDTFDLYKGVEDTDNLLSDGKSFSLVNSVTISSSNLSSGVLFVADKPIGLFCGNLMQNDADDNFNQMLPTSVWGRVYRIPSLGDTVIDRPFRGELNVQAYMANTFFSIDGDFNSNFTLTTIGQVETGLSINLEHKYVIASNYPIAVSLVLIDSTNTNLVSFHIVPPVQSYSSNYYVFAPMQTITNYFTSFGTLSSFSFYSISTDGLSLKRTQDLSKNVSVIPVPEACFGLTVVVSVDSKWLAVPGYTNLHPLIDTEPTCEISTTEPGDNKDNDCDNLVDEDICYSGYGVYGDDYDIDGDFNEDCKNVTTEPVIVAKSSDPVCIIINKPDDQCWLVCECKCSWVRNYEIMQNMTTQEFVAFQKSKSDAVQKELSVKTDELSSSSSQFVSADDERQSAKNIGYLGIGLFAVIFGTIFIMDISSLLRDLRTFGINFKHGIKRCWNFFCCRS